MTSKQYVKSILCFLLLLAVTILGLGFFLDPYNVFHAENFRDNGVDLNRHYLKMSYLMKYPDRYNSLLFGSSCVSAIHVEKIDDVKCYNMTYPNSVPSEYLQNIKTLLDNHMHIKRVYIGLETGSYTHSAGANSRQPMTCQYEYLRDNPYKMITLFFNPSMILRSLPVMVSYVRKRSSGTLNRASLKEDFYGSGAIIAYGMRDDGTNPLARSIYADSKFSEHVHVLKDIQDIVDLCKKENIELVVFTNPLHKINYIASVKGGYLEFLKGLAEITEFYNFCGLNDLTMSSKSFFDIVHYKAETGDVIISSMYNGKTDEKLYKQGFGWKVNKQNIEEFLTLPEISCANI